MKILKSKKAMETWMLVLIILGILFLFAIVAWYAGLNEEIKNLLGKVSNAF